MTEGAPFRIVGQDRHAANCPDLLRAVRETSATLQTALVHVPEQITNPFDVVFDAPRNVAERGVWGRGPR